MRVSSGRYKRHRGSLLDARVQELCESRGGRPGLSVLMSIMFSVDIKQHWTMHTHWSQFVPNMSTRHPRTLSSISSSSSSPTWLKKTANRWVPLCTLMAQSPKTSHGGASVLSKAWPPFISSCFLACKVPASSLKMEWRYKHTVSAARDRLKTPNKNWDGKTKCINVQHPLSKTLVDVLSSLIFYLNLRQV